MSYQVLIQLWKQEYIAYILQPKLCQAINKTNTSITSVITSQ